MENQEYTTESFEELFADYEDFRNGTSKITSILKSMISIISIIASSTLIWMIMRSHKGISTTQHRILLGLCISDIFFSLSSSDFNLMSPRDNSYQVWNARGNVTTYNIQGYLRILGMCSGLLYNCSLNLYYLAVVKFEKSDKYIREKLEPFFHGVPISWGLITSSILVAKKNINDNKFSSCYFPVYNPPHCEGYDDGVIRDGFEIPCGRGYDGFVLFSYSSFFISTFIPPIIISISFWMIYKAVLNLEKKTSRYGSSVYIANIRLRNNTNEENRTKLNQSRSTQICLKIRAIRKKAMGYSIAYFLAWGFSIVGIILSIAGVKWPIELWYFVVLTHPAQGLFTFITFIYPKVLYIMHVESGNLSWYQAFTKALCSRGNDKMKGTKTKVRPDIVGTNDNSGIVERNDKVRDNNQGDILNFVGTQQLRDQQLDGSYQDIRTILHKVKNFDVENGSDERERSNHTVLTEDISEYFHDQVEKEETSEGNISDDDISL